MLMLGNFIPYIAPYTTDGVIPTCANLSGWTALGSQKAVAEFNYSEKYAGVKTVESGNEAVKAIMESQSATCKLTLSDITVAKLDEWSAGISNFDGAAYAASVLTVTNKVGQIASEYILRLHPAEMGTDYSNDIILCRIVANKSFEKKGTYGDQAAVVWDCMAMWNDSATPRKVVFGAVTA